MLHGAEPVNPEPLVAQLHDQAQRLAGALHRGRCRVVFAESCTGGLVSAALTAIPGISEYHCGSAVVYRIDTKARWLGVDCELLARTGAVSEQVAADLAAAVLERTPEADLAAAVTGHLGPDAPPDQDGLLYVATAARAASEPSREAGQAVTMHRLPLPAVGTAAEEIRRRRQFEAALIVLRIAQQTVEGFASFPSGQAT